MPYERRLACVDCGKEFTATTANRIRCDSCRKERIRLRGRSLLAEQTCTICDRSFVPYRSGQVTCGKAECKQARTNEIRTPERDDQIEKLFRYYKERSSITVDNLKEGTRVLITGDHQLPFVDEDFEIAKQRFIEDWKPGVIVLNGDIIDAYELSEYDKRPSRMFNLEDEINQAKQLVADYKRLSGGQLFWVDGNHEERLQRIIWKKAQEFSFLVSDLPEALELEKTTAGFVPYGQHVDLHGFVITHGTVVRMHSAYTAKAMMDRYRSSGCNGHTHRIGSHSITDHRGVSHTWFETGCSCRKDLEYMKAHPNWQSGFLIGEIHGGALHPSLVRVIEARGQRGFVAGGNYYRIK